MNEIDLKKFDISFNLSKCIYYSIYNEYHSEDYKFILLLSAYLFNKFSVCQLKNLLSSILKIDWKADRVANINYYINQDWTLSSVIDLYKENFL